MTTILANTTIPADTDLWSCNHTARLVFQGDGNLVLYHHRGAAIWAAGVSVGGSTAKLLQDGNLVVRSPEGETLWESGTAGNPNARLVVQNDANLVIYNENNECIWNTGTHDPECVDFAEAGPVIPNNKKLMIDLGYHSRNGSVRLVMQGDGNLVLYKHDGQPVWCSETASAEGGNSCVLQADGNLVIYNAQGEPLFATETYGQNGAFMLIGNEGNVALLSQDGSQLLWSTRTGNAELAEMPDRFTSNQPLRCDPQEPPALPEVPEGETPPYDVQEMADHAADEQLNFDLVVDVDPSEILPATEDPTPEQTAESERESRKLLAALDVDAIHHACKGFGTKDSILIGAICSRNKDQLQLTSARYSEVYGKSLLELISSECSGAYEDFLILCLLTPVQAKIRTIRKATKGMGTNDTAVMEMFLSSSHEELLAIKEAWDAKYSDEPFLDTIKSELSGDFEKLILFLLKKGRPEGGDEDEELAKEQAAKLAKAAKGFGVDEDVFIEILAGSSPAQVQHIKVAYEQLKEKSLQSLIESEFSGIMETALLGLLFPSRHHFLARRLVKAMEGVGTNDAAVVRIIGCHDKAECRKISEAYLEMTGHTLQDHLAQEISGDFLKSAVKWIMAVDPGDSGADSLMGAVVGRDVEEIWNATKGLGTDESRLIDVLCCRDKHHLYRVDLALRERHHVSLVELLDSECSGDLGKLLKFIAMPNLVFDMYLLKKATKGLGTNEALMIEVLASRPGERLQRLRQKFDLSGSSLIDLINSEMSGLLRDICLILLEGRPTDDADEGLAAEQAAQLHEAGTGQWGTNEEKFLEVIGKSSLAQCDAIRKAYESQFEESLESAIKSEFSGALKQALLAMLLNPVDYHCVRLKNALEGFVSEGTVCRALGGLNKSELKELEARFFERYDQRLVDLLGSELSGDFKRACVKWVSAEPFGN